MFVSPLETEPEASIRLCGVTRLFGPFAAVNQFSLHVRPGEIVGLLGPNGAGKTTSVRMLMGMLRPTIGTEQQGTINADFEEIAFDKIAEAMGCHGERVSDPAEL